MKALMTLLLAVTAASAATAPAKPNGAKLFAAKCSACHAKNGKGSLPMAKMFGLKDPSVMNLTSEVVAKKTDAELQKTILDGRNKMPSFKGKLKPSELSELIAYIRSLSAAPAAPKAPKGDGK